MNYINLIINNKKVRSLYGNTILVAARLAGFYIPSLCGHPNLPTSSFEFPVKEIFQGSKKIKNKKNYIPSSGCGLCIVEIENKRNFIKACEVKIQEGMIISTNNDRIKKERKKKLIPFLSRHKHACLTCSQQEGCSRTQCSSNVPETERCCSNFSDCEFKNIVDYIGIDENTPNWNFENLSVLKNQPLLNIDYNLCIGCTRCVRICSKLRGVSAIGFVWNSKGLIQIGTKSKNYSKSDCKFCTSCIEVCPTNALQDDVFDFNKKKKEIVPCKINCPANIDIPVFLEMIKIQKIDIANNLIQKKVPFPSVLGRVCMHPCQNNCKRKKIDDPISICTLKRFTSSKYQNNKYIDKKHLVKDYNKKNNITIIGSGPAGLTSAYFLNKKSYNLVIYESKEKAGGMLQYAIPSYRLPKKILNNEINNILSSKINIKFNTQVGKDLDFSHIKKNKNDTIIIAIGAQKDRILSIKGSNHNGVIGAVSFLSPNRKKLLNNIPKESVIIGGGNVAIDAALTALNLGSKKVTIVCLESEEEMPANSWEISYAKRKGVRLLTSWGPTEIIEKNKNIIGINFIKCNSVVNKKGFFDPQYNKSIKKYVKADQVIVAIGQSTDLEFIKSSKISLNNDLIATDKNTLETNVKNVYAGGDVSSTSRSIINAVASGKIIAKNISETLNKEINKTKNVYTLEKNTSCKIPINHCIKSTKKFFNWNIEKNSIKFEDKINKLINEITFGFNNKQAIKESSRCLQCNLRSKLKQNPAPPDRIISLTLENLDLHIPKETEGVFKLLNKDMTVTSITGTATLRKDLLKKINKDTKLFFEFEIDKMYSKRESEILQKYIQKFGNIPSGDEDDNLDDLF